jgi:hypothetical protein|tara:strand:- start:1807 stop:2157 length:351 start_codon:yes stop_codon:yes gene_type:complete
VKSELRIIFLADDGTPFFTEEGAIKHENKSHENKQEVDMTIVDLIKKVIEDNNWGIYYKAKPLQNLQVQDGVPLLRVNDVDLDTVSNELGKALNKMEEKLCKEQNRSQTDSQQEKS